QHAARSAEAGVALSVRLPDGSIDRSVRAGLWLALVRAAAGKVPAPTLFLDAGPRRLWVFYRPVDGADLAALLDSRAEGPADDLAEPWQTWPPSDAETAARVEELVATAPAPLGD